MVQELGGSQLSMTVLMTPDMANFAGNVHGGHLLKLLDQVAYACASQYSGLYVVTVSVDQVAFREPIRVGELVSFQAAVNYTGRCSMEVGIKVLAADIHSGLRRHTNSCYFTMVAMDAEGRPTPAPAHAPKDDDERRRHGQAQMRRSLRAELQERYEAIQAGSWEADEGGQGGQDG